MQNTMSTTKHADLGIITTLGLLTLAVVWAGLAHLAPQVVAGAAHPAPQVHTSLSAPDAMYQVTERLDGPRLVWQDGVIYADVEDAPEWFTNDLLEAGFYGDPSDRHERLYAPRVADVENAAEWVVDALLQAGYTSDPTDGHERLYAPLHS